MAGRKELDSDAAGPPAQGSAKRSKAWLWILVVVVVATGAGGGGAVAGAKLLAKRSGRSVGASAKEAVEQVDGIVPDTTALGDVVVDVRSAEGEPHHLKVGIAVELRHGTDGEEIKRLVPKGREAIIVYLRSKTYEELTGPGTFRKVLDELNTHVVAAFGEKRAKRVLVTDYLAQ